MYVCSMILGQPWTKKRELRSDKSCSFSWRKIQFLHKGQWVSFESYTSEKYLVDRKRRDHAHATIDAKKNKAEILPEKKGAESDLVVVKNISSHEELNKSGAMVINRDENKKNSTCYGQGSGSTCGH